MKTSKTVKRKGIVTEGLFVALLFAGIGFLASCSDKETIGNETQSAEIETGKVIINNDAEELSKRVTLYKSGASTARTRVGKYTLDMPEQPTVPDDAVDMSDDFQTWAPNGEAFVLKADAKKTIENLNLNGAEWYVSGELTITKHWGEGKIYILPGGKLIYNPDGLNSVAIYNYGGTFEPTSASLTINSNSAYMTTGDFSLDKSLNVSGRLYVGGNFSVPVLDANNSSVTFVGGDATFATKAEVTNSSGMYVNGKLTAPYFELNSNTNVVTACRSVFSEKLYLTNTSTFQVLEGGSVTSPETKLDSNCELLVGSKGFLDLGELTFSNAPTTSIEATGSEYAVVKATTISVNYNDLRNTFKGYIGLHYDELQDDNSQSEIQFQSNVLVNGNDKTVIPAGGCNPGYNNNGSTEPTDPDKKQLVIDHIANVQSPDPDHTHDISATCVQMVGNKAYVSYHQQGTSYSGCAEVINFDTNETLSLVSYMRSVESRDFNHLIVDDGKIYLTGGENKGAFMAYIPLSDGIFSSGDADELEVVRLPGSDANCVVRNGSYYLVATTAGLQTLNASDYSSVGSKETPGSAKFIHLNGDKMLTLNLTTRGSEQSGAAVNIYNSTDYLFESPQTTISEGTITPVNGKNVSRVDGNNVYVCLGGNGFVRYTNGSASGSFKLEDTKSAVNGMDFDDNYIYIAYGSEGLYVLDKDTLEVVASYTHSGGKSANYVKVDNGYIFVAYGRNGLQVFKLVEK